MTINREMLTKLREAVNEALAPVGGKFEVSIKLGNVTFSRDGTDATAKLEILALVTNDDGKVEVFDQEAADFKQHAHRFGMHPNDISETFMFSGVLHRITGLKAKRRKYPIRIENVQTGVIKVTTADAVNRGLGRPQPERDAVGVPYYPAPLEKRI